MFVVAVQGPRQFDKMGMAGPWRDTVRDLRSYWPTLMAEVLIELNYMRVPSDPFVREVLYARDGYYGPLAP